ncbi:MAG: bifunctional hydroxymethylpyrimidine kinase/phosphomethylpyrimidine kinase [Kiritimatiellia bacterium]
MRPVAWTVAGTDPAGAAGVFADLATFEDFGAHGCAVITAVLAQNSKSVSRIQFVPPAMLRAQMESLAQDYPPLCIKTGMLGRAAAVREVSAFLKKSEAFVVCDPVMVSSSGGVLLDEAGRRALKKYLFPRVDLLTPNIPEAEFLMGHAVSDFSGAAAEIMAMGVKSVLIKGGHASGAECRDYWTDGKDSLWLSAPRIADKEFRGTGCVLSSAIAAGIAQGRPVKEAVAEAKKYVTEAMRRSIVCAQGKWILAHHLGSSRMPDSSRES